MSKLNTNQFIMVTIAPKKHKAKGFCFGVPVLATGENAIKDDLTKLVQSGQKIADGLAIYQVGLFDQVAGIVNTDVKKLFDLDPIVKKYSQKEELKNGSAKIKN